MPASCCCCCRRCCRSPPPRARGRRLRAGAIASSQLRSMAAARDSHGSATDKQLEQRLLRVQPVLGLVPDGGALAVERRSSVISSPGCAGRQWSAIASSGGRGEQRVVEPVRREQLALARRRRPRRPCSPTRRCRARARRGRTRPSVEAGSPAAVSLRAAPARAASPRPPRRPPCAPSISSERAMLLPSPTYASFSPSSRRRSARAASPGRRAPGRGGGRAVSMLITGTLACSASSSTVSCGPVRTPIAWTIARQHERGVARRLAARELQLALAQHERVAAQLGHPDLERDARARGRPARTRARRCGRRARSRRPGRAFSSTARSSSAASSAAVSSSPVRK